MVERYDKVLLRKVNIVDWESPAANQAEREFGLQALPYVRIYGRSGQLIDEVSGADVEAIEAAVKRGL